MKPPLLLTDWTNRVALDPDHTTHGVESFFIKANDPERRRAVWLRLTLFMKGAERYGDVWAIWFDGERSLAAKQRFPWRQVGIDPERAGLGVGECTIEDAGSYGVVRGDDCRMVWRLHLAREFASYTPLPLRLYRSRLVGSKTCTPNPSAVITGTLELWRRERGAMVCEKVELEGWRGMQGHNWGKRHAERYAWSHCNLFEGETAPGFFEAFAAQVRVAGILTPPLSFGRLVLDGETYRFDTWRNLKPVPTEFAPMRWKFTLRGPQGELAGRVQAEPADTVGLTYPNPNGAPRYCHNSKLARLSLELRLKRGKTRTLVSDKAALEIIEGAPDPAIAVKL